MSACISREGEYSAHKFEDHARFVCARCFVFDEAAALAALNAAEAEAHNLAHEVDRVRERLWRLAALAGWRPGNPADNDAIAELYITEALKTRDDIPPGGAA
jgi:hypothetical protein